MKSLTFLGAAGEVTGSSHLLTDDNGKSLLIDLGMYQGTQELEDMNFVPLDVDVSKLEGVIITHAHLDHCGRLPLLIRAGYGGKYYATEPTKEIVQLSLQDSARILKEDDRADDVFTEETADIISNRIETVEYEKPFQVGQFSLVFRNAGHILGSAFVEVTDAEGNIFVFSGDLGNTPQDLVQPTEYSRRADVVVMESTYGNGFHPDEDADALLQHEINTIEKSGGTLLIPAFSIERTQELLHMIGHLKSSARIYIDTPVYLDSPMAAEVTEIYKKYPKLYSNELSRDHDPFEFPGLVITRYSQDSRRIKKVKRSKIIIAGSGMMSGGRIMQHLQDYVSLPTTRILIVGYQAEETLGREIEEGAKSIMIKNRVYPVNASVTKMHSLSSHADQPRLLKWLGCMEGVKKVFLVHGEQEQRQVLAEKIKSQMGIEDVVLPLVGETHPVGMLS